MTISRLTAASVCGMALALAAFTGPAHAAGEVRIGGFPFSCKTPDGKTLQPRHGDIPGITFIDMPAQYEQCVETIKRKIVGCEMNTDFGGYRSRDKRYPGCLPIFEEQAKACVAFYHREKAKCDAWGPGAARAGDEAGPDRREAPAHEALIASFRFSCKTSDGKTVHPKFGDIPRAYFTDMPAQREQCLEAINYKIAGCESNTTFRSNTEAERYPRCEQVFEEQAKACAAFYREERAKCDIGSAEAGTPGEADGTEGGAAADADLEPKCEDMEEGATCWRRISGGRECWTLDDYNYPGKTFTSWSGSCSGGVADGEGTLVWTWGEQVDGELIESTGTLVDSKKHGHWVWRYTDGSVHEGPYVDGKQHGHWVQRAPSGSVHEGPYVDGKMHGNWVKCFASGRCYTTEWLAGDIVEGSK